jgi:hypothetical protein
MSKQPKPDPLKELLADLDSITPTAPERLAYQVGFLSSVLARIYAHDWILRNEWNDRIEAIRIKRSRD